MKASDYEINLVLFYFIGNCISYEIKKLREDAHNVQKKIAAKSSSTSVRKAEQVPHE